MNILHHTRFKFVTSYQDSLLFQSEGKSKLYSKLSWDLHQKSGKNRIAETDCYVQMESCPKNVVIKCCLVAVGKLP